MNELPSVMETYPRGPVAQPPVEIRNYTGWLFLAVLFALSIASAFLGQTERKAESYDVPQFASEIKQSLSESSQVNSKVGDADYRRDLLKVFAKVAPLSRKDISAAEILGAVQLELHRPIASKDVSILKTGSPNQRKLYEIFTSPKLSVADATKLATDLPTSTFIQRLLRADAFAKAGQPALRNGLINELHGSNVVEYALVGCVLLASLVLWTGFLIFKMNRELKPLGLPNMPATVFGADRLACKALLFFGIYLVLMLIVELSGALAKGAAHDLIELGGGVATIAFLPIIFRIKFGGGSVPGFSLGMPKHSPWLLYGGIGLAAFLMEYPVSMAAGALGERLLSNHVMNHPATVELTASHNPLLILSLFFLASVQAPIYEEIIFRGFMLPAFARLTGFGWSILITSVLFASLHPQGVGAWLGLATIAASSCILIYHTRSIVPSIFLHAFHNGFTLLMVLLMS